MPRVLPVLLTVAAALASTALQAQQKHLPTNEELRQVRAPSRSPKLRLMANTSSRSFRTALQTAARPTSGFSTQRTSVIAELTFGDSPTGKPARSACRRNRHRRTRGRVSPRLERHPLPGPKTHTSGLFVFRLMVVKLFRQDLTHPRSERQAGRGRGQRHHLARWPPLPVIGTDPRPALHARDLRESVMSNGSSTMIQSTGST